MKPEDIETMSDDDITKHLIRRFHFEADEVKTLFPTEVRRKEALTEMLQVNAVKDVDEDALGWDDKDKTVLTADQKAQVKGRIELRKKVAEAKVRHEKKVEQEMKQVGAIIADAALSESLEETKAPVTKAEVKKTMAEIQALLRDTDTE